MLYLLFQLFHITLCLGDDPYCHLQLSSIHFLCCVVFYFMNMQQFIYLPHNVGVSCAAGNAAERGSGVTGSRDVLSCSRYTLLLSPESQTSLLTPAFNFGKNVALLCHFYYKCIFHLFLYVFISSMKVLYYGKMFTFQVVKLISFFYGSVFHDLLRGYSLLQYYQIVDCCIV